MKSYKDRISDYKVSTYPLDLSLGMISEKIDTGDIIIPIFQRNYVWNITQASRLIESLLLGLPIPQIFVYLNDEGVMEVIDGQQRILSVKFYMDGEFDNKKPFVLTQMTILDDLNGLSFNELPVSLQRKIRDSSLRFLCVEADSMYKDDVIIDIFSRLNIGGTSLTTQEVRNAIYHSPFIDMLRGLSKNEDWLKITSGKINSKRAMDIEVILKVYAFTKHISNYHPPFNYFINHVLAIESSISKEKIKNYKNILVNKWYKEKECEVDIYEDFKNEFIAASNAISIAVKKPFFIKNRFKKVYLESFLIGFMSHGLDGIFKAGNPSNIAQAHDYLSENDKFISLCSSRVNEDSSFYKRLDMVRDVIFR
ncbi:TPA: DUF262 domain-containing protein [Proteus mirabilis]|nr:DUF262 domain-containing protein [Proteus mirabilis]